MHNPSSLCGAERVLANLLVVYVATRSLDHAKILGQAKACSAERMPLVLTDAQPQPPVGWISWARHQATLLVMPLLIS